MILHSFEHLLAAAIGAAPLRALAFLLCLLPATALQAASPGAAPNDALERLTEQRQALTVELSQYEQTLELLNPDGDPPELSENPAVRKLAAEAVRVKEQLLAIAAEEVTLLQREIHGRVDASRGEEPIVGINEDEELIASDSVAARTTMEGKPLRSMDSPGATYAADADVKNVERLHELLQDYFAQVQASANILPTDAELAAREKAQRDVENLTKIPYSADKVRLTGAEGSTALAHITQRLMNPAIPESRRDTSPICSIKTYLFDTLVASENRSLQPVGKNHYVARIRLQPGESSLNIQSTRWDISLPQQAIATDYLITFYNPPGRDPQLHLFAIEDLLAQESPHIPAWLPEELNIQTNQG